MVAFFFTASEVVPRVELEFLSSELLRYFLGGIGDMLRNSVSQVLRSGRTFSVHLSEEVENITP